MTISGLLAFSWGILFANQDLFVIKRSNPIPAGKLRPEFRGDSIIIPIKRVGNLFLIDAEVDGKKGNFVLDLGAVGIVLNQTYFRNTYTDARLLSGGITNTATSVQKTWIKHFDLQGLSFKKFESDVFELGDLENRRGIKILGLLGIEIFKTVEMVIDTRNSVLKLFPLNDGRKSSRKVSNGETTIPLQLKNNVILIQGKISGNDLWFSFDTGAEINVLDNKNDPAVLESVKIERRVLLRGVGGDPVEVLAGAIDEVQISGLKFQGMKTIIADLGDMESNYGLKIDGMLGFDFLSKGVISINLKAEKMGYELYSNRKTKID